MNRNKAREQAFLLIFSDAFYSDISADEIINNAIAGGDYESDEFCESLIFGAIEHKAEIDALIEKNLAKGWRISRLSKAVLSILRLAVYEIRYCDEIPVAVSINEAVELAKKYGDSKDYSFVNGILGNIAKEK